MLGMLESQYLLVVLVVLVHGSVTTFLLSLNYSVIPGLSAQVSGRGNLLGFWLRGLFSLMRMERQSVQMFKS